MAHRDFLAFFILTSCLVSGQSPRYVLKGQKVTLKKDITGQPDNILWKHNGNKVVEFNGREEHVYDPYKTRVTLDWLSAELYIIDLRLEDSGKYELQVSVNQNLQKSHHDVEILDRVAKPSISCKIHNSNSGTLVCSAEPRQPVHLMKIEWHSQGNVHPGPHLQISLGDELDDQVYSCMVSNPLSTETAAFTAKDCYTTKSSSLALIVIVIVISLLLLIAGAGILYCYLKQKGRLAKRQTDLEKQETDITEADKGAAKTEQLSESADEEKQKAEPNYPTVVSSGKVKAMAKDYEKKHNTVGEKHIAEQHKGATSGSRKEFKQASVQNSTDHQNAEASSSSVPPPDAGQSKDDINNKNTTVEDHLTEAPDKQEGHASNESVPPAESADVGQNTSSEQKSSTVPVSPASDKNKHQPSVWSNFWGFFGLSRVEEAAAEGQDALEVNQATEV